MYAPGEETQAELRQELEKAMVALERRVNAVDSEVRQAKPVLVVGKPGQRGPRGKPGTLALLSPVPRDTICACSAYRVRHTPQCNAYLPWTNSC